MELRDYQKKCIELIKKSFIEKNKKVLVFLATGAGKGLLMSHITDSAIKKGGKVLTIMRRRQVVFQTIKNYKKYHDIDSSPIMGTEKIDTSKKSQVCSVDTLIRRFDKCEFLKEFSLVIVDECFKKETYISTNIGKVTIGTLYLMKDRPMAKSFNEKTKKFEYKKILNVFKNSKKDFVLEVKCGISKIICTENHLLKTDSGYKRAKDLTTNDALMLDKKTKGNEFFFSKVSSIKKKKIKKQHMYDLEVEDNHNYVVMNTRSSDSGFLVHNCHDTTSDSYKKVFEFLGEKKYVGFSATPFPVGKKVHSFWDCVVKPIETKTLRDMGFLVDADVFVPVEIDLSSIKIDSYGDYEKKELSKKMQELKIVGDVVENYKKYGNNRPAICFCVDKNHSSLMAEKFSSEGIPAIHCDESTPQKERDQSIRNLQTGKIKVLCNVNIFSTGVDIPEAEVGLMARPTKSEILYIQQLGRLLRPHRRCGKCHTQYDNSEKCPCCGYNIPEYVKTKATIIDFGNNTSRFGLPFDVRYAAINEKEKKENEKRERPLVKTCTNCFSMYDAKLAKCPYCEGQETKEKFYKTKDGELRLYNEFESIKSTFHDLSIHQDMYGYKPNWKFFKLYERYKDDCMKYKKELGIPDWVPNIYEKNLKEKNGKKEYV